MPPTPAAAGRLRGLIPPLGRRAWHLLGGVFLFEIGTGMTLPLLIVYLHGPVGLSLSQAGVSLSVMGVSGLAGTPVAGVVADRAGAGWTAAGGLLAAAAVFGLGETFLSPSLPAIVNDLAAEHTRGRYVAFYSLSWQAGPMIGPLVAGPAIGAGDGAALLVGLAAAAHWRYPRRWRSSVICRGPQTPACACSD